VKVKERRAAVSSGASNRGHVQVMESRRRTHLMPVILRAVGLTVVANIP
jgi:hypothetical protein